MGNPASGNAQAMLSDPSREFCSSIFVRLEVLPKPIYFKNTSEVIFYNSFFQSVQFWATDLTKITEEALSLASTYGLATVDALHVAAALWLNADEFVTSEKVTKPLFRVMGLKLTSIQP